MIDRAAILGDGQRLAIAAALGGTGKRESLASAGPPGEGGQATAWPTLDQAQRRHIEAALSATQGRIEGPRGAAQLLDINPHTLRARMRKLGIDWGRFRPDPQRPV